MKSEIPFASQELFHSKEREKYRKESKNLEG